MNSIQSLLQFSIITIQLMLLILSILIPISILIHLIIEIIKDKNPKL